MADGMSFRGCLSGGGDIFSKSVEKQGGANRTFATGGRCHGWQLEPCPCGLEPLLTFRQKIPTGRPYIEEGHSVRHGHSWICFTNSQFTLPVLPTVHIIFPIVPGRLPALWTVPAILPPGCRWRDRTFRCRSRRWPLP